MIKETKKAEKNENKIKIIFGGYQKYKVNLS